MCEALWFSETSRAAQSSGPGHSGLLPAHHRHSNRAKQLLSPPGRAQGLPQAGLSQLWPKASMQRQETEMLLASEVLDGVADPAPLNHPTRQAEQQAPPSQALKREEQQAVIFPEQFWQVHWIPGNINNCSAIWNCPWAGQHKSPRLCPVPTGYSVPMQKVPRGWHSPHQDPEQTWVLLRPPASSHLHSRLKGAPAFNRGSEPPSPELTPGLRMLSSLPRHQPGFKVLEGKDRQEQTSHSIIHHFSSFYSFICTAIFYRTH